MAKKYLINKLNNTKPAIDIFVTPCDTFLSKFLGLMFKKHLEENEGILLIQEKSNKIDSAIHMFFMNFNISVFWLDEYNCIVDKVIAKKWHPIYISKENAKIVLETHINNYNHFCIGDVLSFEEI